MTNKIKIKVKGNITILPLDLIFECINDLVEGGKNSKRYKVKKKTQPNYIVFFSYILHSFM